VFGYAATAADDSVVFAIKHRCDNRAFQIDTLAIIRTNATQDSVDGYTDSLTYNDLGWTAGGWVDYFLFREADAVADSLKSDFYLTGDKWSKP